jgi:hypothetical protein
MDFMKAAIADKKDEHFPGAPPEVPAGGKDKVGKTAAVASDGEAH